MEVVRFVRFMKAEAQYEQERTDPMKTKFRTAGMYRGQGWMADDFDAPLDDFEEYMQ